MMTRSTMTVIGSITSLPLSREGTRHARVSGARRAARRSRAGCHHASVTKRTRGVLGLTVVLIALLALGAGCGGSATGGSPDLDGSRWKLTSWAEPDPIPRSATITARVLRGPGGGHRRGQPLQRLGHAGTDGSFAVDAPISTKMAGPEDAMAAESAYLQRLQAATSYQVDGDTLVLNDADGQPSLTFTRA